MFAHMLALPRAAFPPVFYSIVMQDLCKSRPATFPPAMAGCAGQLFRRGAALHPAARRRLADWLSHHLSAFGFTWPWRKWELVLAQPPAAPQRRFVSHVLKRLARLSYWRAPRDADRHA